MDQDAEECRTLLDRRVVVQTEFEAIKAKAVET
jgi:hypothetical protein